jgi:hypothetical protein
MVKKDIVLKIIAVISLCIIFPMILNGCISEQNVSEQNINSSGEAVVSVVNNYYEGGPRYKQVRETTTNTVTGKPRIQNVYTFKDKLDLAMFMKDHRWTFYNMYWPCTIIESEGVWWIKYNGDRLEELYEH